MGVAGQVVDEEVGDGGVRDGTGSPGVVTTVEPPHLHGAAGVGDLPSRRVGLLETEQTVALALHQQCRRGDGRRDRRR